MRTLNLVLAGLAVTALALGACAQPPSEQASIGPPAAAQVQVPSAAPARQVEAIVDPSGSVERGQFEASVGALADAVRTLPHALPAHEQSPAQPGVRVGVRAIDGAAYGSDALLAAGAVDPIPGVARLPSGTTGDITQAALAIAAQRRAAAAAYARAHAHATALARRIAGLRPPVAGCSDVWGALSAAAQSFRAPDRRLIVVSDMAIHCRSNVAGSLARVRVLIVHICVSADVCSGQERYWRRALRARGATGVEFARFELMRERIRAYVQEVAP